MLMGPGIRAGKVIPLVLSMKKQDITAPPWSPRVGDRLPWPLLRGESSLTRRKEKGDYPQVNSLP